MQTLTKGKREWLSYYQINIKMLWDFPGGPDSVSTAGCTSSIPGQETKNQKVKPKIKINK